MSSGSDIVLNPLWLLTRFMITNVVKKIYGLKCIRKLNTNLLSYIQ